MSQAGEIDLHYGDETHVCSQGYVPYGWQFPDEEVCIFSEKAYKINCLGLISRQNACRWQTTESTIDAQFVLEFMEEFSFQISRKTFVVLGPPSQGKSYSRTYPVLAEKRTLYFLSATLFSTPEHR